jgi:hypothetical protein
MNCAVHAAAAQQRSVGRIDYRIDRLFGDVARDNGDSIQNAFIAHKQLARLFAGLRRSAAFRPLHASKQQKAVKFPGTRALPTLKRHKCRAPVALSRLQE